MVAFPGHNPVSGNDSVKLQNFKILLQNAIMNRGFRVVAWSQDQGNKTTVYLI